VAIQLQMTTDIVVDQRSLNNSWQCFSSSTQSVQAVSCFAQSNAAVVDFMLVLPVLPQL
jgi:hypothetical protein